MNSMPKNCKVQDSIKPPKGWYKVRMERKGYLYVDINNQTIKLSNPFDYVPIFVKISKLKNGSFKIKEGNRG